MILRLRKKETTNFFYAECRLINCYALLYLFTFSPWISRHKIKVFAPWYVSSRWEFLLAFYAMAIKFYWSIRQFTFDFPNFLAWLTFLWHVLVVACQIKKLRTRMRFFSFSVLFIFLVRSFFTWRTFFAVRRKFLLLNLNFDVRTNTSPCFSMLH